MLLVFFFCFFCQTLHLLRRRTVFKLTGYFFGCKFGGILAFSFPQPSGGGGGSKDFQVGVG